MNGASRSMVGIPTGYFEALDEEFEQMLREEAEAERRRTPPKLEPAPIRLNCLACGPLTVLAEKCVARGSIFCPKCLSMWPNGVTLGYPPGTAPAQAFTPSPSLGQGSFL
jgi:hypothetical protein